MTTLDERPALAVPAGAAAPAPAPAPDAATAADLLRGALRRHAAGVTVITVAGPGGQAGFTATSFTSVSLEPALVSFYLAATASSAPAVRACEAFTVHILRHDQQELANRFARSGIDRFADTPWHTGPHGTPLLPGAAARLTARTTQVTPVGDHLLVVGEVVGADTEGGPPLVHHNGGYGRFAADLEG
ncbi:flavin reductase family protein [Streptomyces sp. BE303]|uniref:flavin reductase family protein n=1 Tax=Streptomyces sp. BE303 TaxID=3002528 RepID=UPI002E7743FD|nr:flavin reductase family protein [Streptomyces sp. BE303]MED7947521.1 flavin reductase family protein [Streptomyces sp. BE303]